LTSDGSAGYQWDAEGRLIAITNGGGTLRSFAYNALGDQAEWHGDGRMSEIVNDLARHVVGSVNPSTGAWEGERIPGGKGYLAWYVNGGTTFFHYNTLGSSVRNPGSPTAATGSECDRAGHALPAGEPLASSPAREKRLVRLPHCAARYGVAFGQGSVPSSRIMGPTRVIHMRRNMVVFTFSVLNAALLFACFELWRERQPLERTAMVGLVSLPVTNLVGWRR
jgi:YD repeat-containing protein